ncbi:pentapeptide repeat-containing protein [Nonomuraea zeae]|uniref:Pentapeptide repeat-containing protein n=1 Tax=Nonomuraea zeae TaxID=1642303 RepID=A0A5S4GSU1_9ACTN|nr:pentapeptide repeat-containing protein [Nonomuraea zeae]TMR35986.1 pentapeptide repeat-containing protein [Nonomuraea zeae]
MSGQQETGQQQTGQQQTGQQPSTVNGGLPVTTQLSPPSSGISFKPGVLDAASNKIDSQAALLAFLRTRSGDMGVPFPGFGVIGLGIAKAHDRAIERQSFALDRGKKALESWKVALKKADANYRTAEETSGEKFEMERVINAVDGGGIDTSGLDGELPTGDLPGADLPGTDLSGTDLPGTDLPGSDLPGADLPGADLPGTGPPGSNLDGTDSPKTDLPGTDLANTNLSGADDPNMKVPDIDAALNPPQDKTGLSSFDPSKQLNGLPNPDLLNAGTRSGTTLGSPSGSGVGGVGSPSASGLRPAPATPSGMGSGTPMMPMMPMTGAGSGHDERDREEGSLLSEDEGVWGDDEDIAPEVIGKEK